MIDDMGGAMRGRRPMQKAETDEHARRARAARRFDVEDAVADQRRAAATAPLDHREGRRGGGLRRAWTQRVAAHDRRHDVREPPCSAQDPKSVVSGTSVSVSVDPGGHRIIKKKIKLKT